MTQGNGQMVKAGDVQKLFSSKSFQDQIKAALPRILPVERFIRVAMTQCRINPALLECSQPSLLGSLMTCAQLGLEPGPHLGLAYLVPFYNKKTQTKEVQFIPGYRGILDLARRSKEISTISAMEVYAADDFEFAYGINPKLHHKPALDGRDEKELPIYFYAVAILKDGGYQFEVMTKADVDKIRARSKAASSGPWVTDYNMMGRKTVLKRLCKVLPMSVELATAMTAEDGNEPIPMSIDTSITVDPPTALDEAAASLQSKTKITKDGEEVPA